MPKREDIKSILVIGAGPIIIGQACEFDYSGTQACKALKEDGYRVILINSNPATIMTDPLTADKTYIEPITPDVIKRIIEIEKPDAILPTIGGQTGLNAAVKVAEAGYLEEHGVELIGADIKAIKKAEDRQLFREAMNRIGLKMTKSVIARSIDEAMKGIEEIGFPAIIRASFTLGGTGGAIAYNLEEYRELALKGIQLSMIGEIIVEQSIAGWKEYELEVMKDTQDNVIIICSIENFDPMGVHTGDSITVAPQQTLSDKEYQLLRDYSIAIIREIGVSTGGSNIQFAVNPETSEVIVIEMNPRVSRSSALASKATGFPIAKIAAKLAVGWRLDEIPNDITRSTPASFEPAIDYVVTKMPRFAFEKFRSSIPNLGVQMKSVGETMAIGRTFKESFQKAARGLETRKAGFEGMHFTYAALLEGRKKKLSPAQMFADKREEILDEVEAALTSIHYSRVFYLKDAMYLGLSDEDIFALTKIDRWFLANLREIFDAEKANEGRKLKDFTADEMRDIKKMGFSDIQIAWMCDCKDDDVMKRRLELGVEPACKVVDTCAAEFEARTPYYYSTYDEEDEVAESKKERIMILGGGPNRIGQGIEFDYMCVQASFALQELGYETIMVNSNPETVSTDYDVSDILFFDPLTYEDVMGLIRRTKPIGVVVQLGGQTPLNLAERLTASGVPLLGTSAESIAIAEDREKFKNILNKLNFKQPANGITQNLEDALKEARKIGYPVLVRPSFVLGGRAMEIVYEEADLAKSMQAAIEASPGQPVLIDKYLEKAVEVDVDCICDGEESIICGIMEHIEEAGIHSGDSACILPPQHIAQDILDLIAEQTKKMAVALKVRGLMNVQFAIQGKDLYFLEVNPRGSRTVPFVSKATGIPWVNFAVKVMAGKKIRELNIPATRMDYIAVKEAVLPFDKFPDEDTILSPEMKSTGEVMGLGSNLGQAYYKSQLAAGFRLPMQGGVLVTVKTHDLPDIADACASLAVNGFKLYATEGTKKFLAESGVESEFIHKVGDGRPDIRDIILNKQVDLIFNTPIGKREKQTDTYIRLLAKQHRIPIMTTTGGIRGVAEAITSAKGKPLEIKAIQDHYAQNRG